MFKMINEAYCVLKLRGNRTVKESEPEVEYKTKDHLWRKGWSGFAEDDDEANSPFYTSRKPLVNFEIISIG